MLSTILLIHFFIPLSASFPTAEPIDVANLVTAAVAIGVATAVAAVKTSFYVVIVASTSMDLSHRMIKNISKKYTVKMRNEIKTLVAMRKNGDWDFTIKK